MYCVVVSNIIVWCDCGYITEFGLAEGDPPPPQEKTYCQTDLQTKFFLIFLSYYFIIVCHF